jgi:uncharacterized membrane protein YfcA
MTGLIFAVASAPGVLAGVLLVNIVPEEAFTLLLAVLLLALAIVAVRGPPRTVRLPLRGPGVIVRVLMAPEGAYRYGYRLWQGVVLSLAVGLVSSLFGIGGGAIHVPAMISWLHIPVQFAVATSQFILAFMSGGGTIIHVANGTLASEQLTQTVALAAGTVPGAQIGARVAHRMKARTVVRLLVIALLALSGRLFIKGIFGV